MAVLGNHLHVGAQAVDLSLHAHAGLLGLFCQGGYVRVLLRYGRLVPLRCRRDLPAINMLSDAQRTSRMYAVGHIDNLLSSLSVLVTLSPTHLL